VKTYEKGIERFIAKLVYSIPGVRRMEDFVSDQLVDTIMYVPWALISYPFRAKKSAEVKEFMQKTGGFIKGVCHSPESFEQIKNAGIKWNRIDLPFPFDAQGSLRNEYIECKASIKRYVDNGIKVMAVTPYPYEYIEFGIDPRLPEHESRVREIARFFITDLRDLIGAMQISNELGVQRFRFPLTTAEVVSFMGLHFEEIFPLRGNVVIGYNEAGPQVDIYHAMKPYHKYCDYVGMDIYIGCFFTAGNWMWIFGLLFDYLWSFTGKPIMLSEFGYMGGGKPKTPEEKRAVLERYGVSTEEEARQNIEAFVKNLPEKMQEKVYRNASGDLGNFLFKSDFKSHLYTELTAKMVIKKYPHTPEGQAGFYRELLPKLMKKPFLIGATIYSYEDEAICYYCGQIDCPVETTWGLTTSDGREKPAYYAVQEAWKNTN